MEFLIADTFTDSLARLPGEEQKAAKTTAFDLQVNPSQPGLSFHKLDKCRDKNFWSVRVSRDIRLIVHRTEGSLLLCYVDHHDKAYGWAERRRLEVHPKTRAAQLVEIRETVEEIRVPRFVETDQPKTSVRRLFEGVSDEDLFGFGVPRDWIDTVRAATEESILGIADHLPSEAAEALLELATGGTPRVASPNLVFDWDREATGERTMPSLPMRMPELSADEGSLALDDLGLDGVVDTPDGSGIAETPTQLADAFSHPDARRRFRTIDSVGELEQALEFPWDKWTVFLHPEQRELVEREQSGPARVSGSAGTGKTIVALHRAVHLARANPEGRILLATYSEPLARALATRLRRLISSEPRLGDRIDVAAIPAVGARLYRSLVGPLKLASRGQVVSAISKAAGETRSAALSAAFLLSEWDQVVDAWQITSWEAYRDVVRLGRKTRLREDKRQALWSVFEATRKALADEGLLTEAGMFAGLATAAASPRNPPYSHAVVDEAQDVSAQQLRFFAALGGEKPNALFFAGDLGQRIFQQPFSWKSLGVDVLGRARTLRVNYRTSHQIRAQADRLLEAQIVDVDGNEELRGDAISVFNGSPPTIRTYAEEAEEIAAVAAWIADRLGQGVAPHEIGLFVRSDAQLGRARAVVEAVGIPFKVLDERIEGTSGFASVGTMHLAKGLEFRAVAVMACDDEVIPLQSRIEEVGEDSDLKEVYDTERQLLYVACTRARDFLLVTGVEPASEFLEDLGER